MTELSKLKNTVESERFQVNAHVDNFEVKVADVEDKLSKDIVKNTEHIVEVEKVIIEESKILRHTKPDTEHQIQTQKQETQHKVDDLHVKIDSVEKSLGHSVENCTGNVLEISKKFARFQEGVAPKPCLTHMEHIGLDIT